MNWNRMMKRVCLWLLLAGILTSAAGCQAVTGGGSQSLDIDYVGQDGEVTEEEVSSEDGSLMAWLRNKLSSDKKESAPGGREDTPVLSEDASVRALYGAEEQTEEKENADAGTDGTRQPESEGGAAVIPTEDNKDGSVDIPLPDQNTGNEDDPSQTVPGKTEKKNTVTFTIRCDTAVANGMAQEAKWTGIVPASGCILPVITMEFEEGETVFDLLCRIRDTYKLQMEYSGANGGEYIEGINNLYEFDGGRWSGWMYCVNDWYPNYGCGQYKVSAGDVIEWNYTCDLGCDLENGDPYGYGQEWKDTHE
ncbi:MAG: DUF4430 domain-containing protein [Eubacteriales bacterium]|nr:DUF4430 domain-containing protein [Eubacteriales bacterium]